MDYVCDVHVYIVSQEGNQENGMSFEACYFATSVLQLPLLCGRCGLETGESRQPMVGWLLLYTVLFILDREVQRTGLSKLPFSSEVLYLSVLRSE